MKPRPQVQLFDKEIPHNALHVAESRCEWQRATTKALHKASLLTENCIWLSVWSSLVVLLSVLYSLVVLFVFVFSHQNV